MKNYSFAVVIPKRLLACLLMLTHFSYIWPQTAIASEEQSRPVSYDGLSLGSSMFNSGLNMESNLSNREILTRTKGELETPDHIEPSQEIAYETDIPGPQTSSISIPEDVRPEFEKLSPLEQDVSRDLLNQIGEDSWEEYLGYFGGTAPQQLNIKLIQRIGKNFAVDDTYTQLMVTGYGSGKDPIGEVVFRVSPHLVGTGGDDISRDYEDAQAKERAADEFFRRWMKSLDESVFNPLAWGETIYDDQGRPVRVNLGPLSRLLVQEMNTEVMNTLGQIEGAGAGGGRGGLLHIIKGITREDVFCAIPYPFSIPATSLLVGLAVKGLVYVATLVATAIIGAIFIAPLARAVEKSSSAILAWYHKVQHIKIMAQLLIFEDFQKKDYLRIINQSTINLERGRWGLEAKADMAKVKLLLRRKRLQFRISQLGRVLGWFGAALTVVMTAYETYRLCVERLVFPDRVKALAGVQFSLCREPQACTLIDDKYYVTGDEDRTTTIVFRDIAEMAPFVNTEGGRATISLKAIVAARLGDFPEQYVNTIEHPRDFANNAGTYYARYAGPGGWGYRDVPGGREWLWNMSPLTGHVNGDLYPPGGYVVAWPPLDPFYPSAITTCDVTQREGRDQGWCSIAVMIEREWDQRPEDCPKVIMRVEFPTVRL